MGSITCAVSYLVVGIAVVCFLGPQVPQHNDATLKANQQLEKSVHHMKANSQWSSCKHADTHVCMLCVCLCMRRWVDNTSCMCVCVCVCVSECVKERERERKTAKVLVAFPWS